MWDALGFRESPYNTNPLKVNIEDVSLLVGRETDSIEFCTALETAPNGVIVISGDPGVGKTSFFNVQQHLLEGGTSLCGPRLLAARFLCPVQPDDDPRILAIRALDTAFRSVHTYCLQNELALPPETEKIGKWLRSSGSAGFDIGIQILGCGGNIGRNVQIQSISEVSFEGISDAIACISSEVTNRLGYDGLFICLDNLENLDDETLARILISYRDTLFSINNIWWVLIGQSGLGSLIQALDRRVFDRIVGSGLEILPIPLETLDEAINIRVRRFHHSPTGIAPLPISIHQALFEASYGEMRFTFKYSNSICTKFVENLRSTVLEILRSSGQKVTRESLDRNLMERIGTHLISSQMPHDSAMGLLRQIVSSELNGLYLKHKEIDVLIKIGDNKRSRPSDYKEFGMKTMQDFSSNYLTKLFRQNLLTREQEGKAVYYKLRGIANISHTLGLLHSPQNKEPEGSA